VAIPVPASVGAGVLVAAIAVGAAAAPPGPAPPRVEVQGLAAADPIDRRAAAVALAALSGGALTLLSAEEAQATRGADADLLHLLGSDPTRAREVLRRRSGDFVLFVETIGGAGEREEVYGIATWPARIEARIAVLRTLDGREVATLSVERSARSTRGPEDAVESASTQAVGAAAKRAEAAILAKAASWPLRQLLRVEPGRAALPGAEAVAGRLAALLGQPVEVETSGAAILVVVSPPHSDLAAALGEIGWRVVDRRPGWWLVATDSTGLPGAASRFAPLDLAVAIAAIAAILSIVAIPLRHRWIAARREACR